MVMREATKKKFAHVNDLVAKGVLVTKACKGAGLSYKHYLALRTKFTGTQTRVTVTAKQKKALDMTWAWVVGVAQSLHRDGGQSKALPGFLKEIERLGPTAKKHVKIIKKKKFIKCDELWMDLMRMAREQDAGKES